MAESTASSRIKPIEQYILAGLCRRLEESLDLAPDSVRVRTREEAYDVFTDDKTSKPMFPFAFLMYGTVDASDAIRSNVTARGLKGSAEMAKDKPFALSIIPVTMGMTLEFSTDDYLRALKFISDKSFMAELNLLDFTLDYRGIDFNIQVSCDSSMTVPTKDGISDTVSAFSFTTDLTIRGYVSSDGGKFDTALKKGGKIKFTAFLNDEHGEVLLTKEVDVTSG